MSERKDDKIDYDALRKGLYGDIFSEKTEKAGRNLLLVATTTLLVSVFNVSVKTAPIVGADFTAQPDSLIMFVAAANVVLLGAYLFRLVPDLLRAQEEWRETRILVELDNIEQEARIARATERQILAQQVSPDGIVEEWWERYAKRAEEIRKRIEAIELRLADRQYPIWFRNFRFWFLSVFPLLVSLVGLAHTGGKILVFLSAVVRL